MSKSENELKESVEKAYTELAQRREFWPNKYDIGLQLSKMLCDYALLGNVKLLGKKVLNIGCSEPIDEVYWINLVEEWHALDINGNPQIKSIQLKCGIVSIFR